MVTIEMLKQIHFLKDLPGHILEKIAGIAQEHDYEEGQILYRQDEVQDIVFMLIKGKVLLNSQSKMGKPMTLDHVKPGRIFGVPALLHDSRGPFTAVCAEPCTMITLSGTKMRQMFQDDFEIGHIFMQKMVEMYKIRREMHNQQFVRSIKTHLEIKQWGP